MLLRQIDNCKMAMLLLFIIINPVFTQILNNVYPEYYLNRQKYRSNHKAETFYLPLDVKLDSSDVYLQALSTLKVSNNHPVNALIFRLSLNSGKWGLYAEPWIVSEVHGKDILGASFSRFGLKGRYIKSYLAYSGETFKFNLGRFRQRWGQSWSHSLLFSSFSLPFNQAALEINLGEWCFDIFAGSFSPELYSDSTKINRHIAGHRIKRSFINNRLLFEAGELILYTGENRSWDIQYLSPFSLYYIDMFDPTNYQRKDGLGWNNENALMFFSLRWIHADNLSIYSEFLLDDLQVHDTGRQHNLGIKIGSDGNIRINNQQLTFELEYTWVNSWTYLNKGQLANFENLYHSSGFPYGPDNHSFRIQLDSWLLENVLIDFDYIYLEKGVNTLRSVPNKVDNINTVNDSFPRPPVNYYNLAKLSLSWWMKYGRVEVGWSNIPFSNTIAYDGSPDINGSVYLKLQGHYTFTGF